MRFLLILLAVSLPRLLCAQEAPTPDPDPSPPSAPAFQATVGTVLAIQAEVPDIKKLEAKAISVLKAKSNLTTAEATALVRVDGQTDVLRCIDYIVLDLLSTMTVARVTGASSNAQHPVAAAAP